MAAVRDSRSGGCKKRAGPVLSTATATVSTAIYVVVVTCRSLHGVPCSYLMYPSVVRGASRDHTLPSSTSSSSSSYNSSSPSSFSSSSLPSSVLVVLYLVLLVVLVLFLLVLALVLHEWVPILSTAALSHTAAHSVP